MTKETIRRSALAVGAQTFCLASLQALVTVFSIPKQRCKTSIVCLVSSLFLPFTHIEASAQVYVSQLDWRLPPDAHPYNTVTKAHDAAIEGSDVLIVAGAYPERLTLSKRLTLKAQSGIVTIGTVFGDNPHKGFTNSYKGQTHCHANVCTFKGFFPDPVWGVFYCEVGSNPTANPRQVEDAYSIAGYDFVALTHHAVVIPDPQASVQPFLHINGEEDGDWGPAGSYNAPHMIGIGISSPADAGKMTCQERLDYFNSQGGLAIIAHPYDNFANHSSEYAQCLGNVYNGHMLKDLYRYVGTEISPESTGNSMRDIGLWDDVLSAGYMRWIFASDDSHDIYSFGDYDQGWIKVQSNQATIERSDIIENIRYGNFFSGRRGKPKAWDRSDSPELSVITDLPNKRIIVTVKAIPDADSCTVYFIGSNNLPNYRAPGFEGIMLQSPQTVYQPLDKVYYEWTGAEGGYIRVMAVDNYGWTTYSQPIKCMQ